METPPFLPNQVSGDKDACAKLAEIAKPEFKVRAFGAEDLMNYLGLTIGKP